MYNTEYCSCSFVESAVCDIVAAFIQHPYSNSLVLKIVHFNIKGQFTHENK